MKLLSFALMILLAGVALSNPAVATEGPYLALDPFVVNIQDGNRSRFLQVKAQVGSDDPCVLRALEAHMPMVRHTMIMLLAHQEAGTIRSPAARQALREQARERLQALLAEITSGPEPDEASGRGIVNAVYFTGLVVQ